MHYFLIEKSTEVQYDTNIQQNESYTKLERWSILEIDEQWYHYTVFFRQTNIFFLNQKAVLNIFQIIQVGQLN